MTQETALARLAQHTGRSEAEIDLIRAAVAPGASGLELAFFLHSAKRLGLDPLARQIYFVKRNPNEPGTIQTGIDGYRLIAARSGEHAGTDDPMIVQVEGAKYPYSATVKVYRLVQGRPCVFTATAHWDEYYPGEKAGFMWRKMPRLMLGKVAEALALRKAFPAELSGVYTREEMDRAGDTAELAARQVEIMGTEESYWLKAPGDNKGSVDPAFRAVVEDQPEWDGSVESSTRAAPTEQPEPAPADASPKPGDPPVRVYSCSVCDVPLYHPDGTAVTKEEADAVQKRFGAVLCKKDRKGR